jgi:sialic acid synthase SpsE
MKFNTKIIAEMGINHCGDMKLAKKIIKAAAKCGVDYIKGQKRTPSECLTEEQYNRPYDNPNSFGKTYGEHKEALEFSKEQWKELFDYANSLGLKAFNTVFDINSANEMEELGQEIYKFGSAETSKHDLIKHVMTFNKPIIVSTGMSIMEEVEETMNILKSHTNDVVVMQCTSTYPCDEKDVNLNVLKTYKEEFPWAKLGFSGHFRSANGGVEAGAVALGATWLERHFTTDRTMKGSDQAASLEPGGMKRVCESVRNLEEALGITQKYVLPCEEGARKKYKGDPR